MARARAAVAAVVPLVMGGWLAGAAPAGAAQPLPTVSVTSPGQNAVETTDTPTISGSVQPENPRGQITAVQVTATPSNLPTIVFSINATPPPSGQDQWSFSAPAPSSSPLAWNGPYSLTATATEQDPVGSAFQGPKSDARSFAEGVSPRPPTGVSAERSSDGSSVTVTWQANPEPDISGYQVQRASPNSSAWSNVGSQTRDTSYADGSAQRGTNYQYRVIAFRPGAQQGQTLASAPSAAASTVTASADGLFGPGGLVASLPLLAQASTDPVAGLVHRAGPSGPITGSPTAGGYDPNLPYGGQSALNEQGPPGPQDPKGGSSAADLLRTVGFVALALILLAIAAHLIRARRSLDEPLEQVGLDNWDQAAGGNDTAPVTVVGNQRAGPPAHVQEAEPEGGRGRPRLGGDSSAITRALEAQRRR